MAAITTGVVTAGLAIKSSVDAKKAQGKALDEQKRQNSSNEAFIREQSEQARADALPLFDQASRTRLLTGQTIQNIFSKQLPAQADVFTQGNVGAQNALLAGLGQQQAAILGQTLDPSALQAQQFTPDFSFLQQADPFLQQQRPQEAPPGETEQQRAARFFTGIAEQQRRDQGIGGGFQLPGQTLNIAEQQAAAELPPVEPTPEPNQAALAGAAARQFGRGGRGSISGPRGLR